MSRDVGGLGTRPCAEPLGDEAGAADTPRLTRLQGGLPQAVRPGERGSSWSVTPIVPCHSWCLHGGTLDVGSGRGPRFGLPLRGPPACAVSEGALVSPRVSWGWEVSAVLGRRTRGGNRLLLAHTHDFCRLLESATCLSSRSRGVCSHVSGISPAPRVPVHGGPCPHVLMSLPCRSPRSRSRPLPSPGPLCCSFLCCFLSPTRMQTPQGRGLGVFPAAAIPVACSRCAVNICGGGKVAGREGGWLASP